MNSIPYSREKSRSLLISLSIFRALVTECRRDVSLLSPSLLASVDVTLTALSSDLEVAARTASVVSSKSPHKVAVLHYYSVYCMDNLYGWPSYWSGQ